MDREAPAGVTRMRSHQRAKHQSVKSQRSQGRDGAADKLVAGGTAFP